MFKITLAAARVNRGLTQKELAKALRVSNRTIISWEQGKTFPRAEKIKEICEVLCVPVEFLNFLPRNSL